MEVRLLITSEKSATRQVRLGPETVIGRSPGCNLRIASAKVSRRHCLIKVSGEKVWVRDLGSSNGTLLNGEPVSQEFEVPVSPGSTLSIGPIKFVVDFERREKVSPLRPVQPPATPPFELPSATDPSTSDEEDTKDYVPVKPRRSSAPSSDEDSSGNVLDDLPAAAGSHADRAAGRRGAFPDDTMYDPGLADHAREAVARARQAAVASEQQPAAQASPRAGEPEADRATRVDSETPPALPIAGSGPGQTADPAGGQAGRWNVFGLFHRKKEARQPDEAVEGTGDSGPSTGRPPSDISPPGIAPVELSDLQGPGSDSSRQGPASPTGSAAAPAGPPPAHRGDEDALDDPALDDFLNQFDKQDQ